MGEVVEITTICEKNTAIKLLNFISNFYNVKYNILKINTMDDWEYKNLVCVDNIDIDVINKKIMVIEARIGNNYSGVTIEKKNKIYVCEIWINPINEISQTEYESLTNVCVDFFKDNDDIHALGIGKELCINYDNGIINGIINSHNVDLWIVSKNYKFKSIQKNIVFI